MNKIKVSSGALFEVGQGVLLALSTAQAAPRRHRLDPVGEGVYRVANNVQFKGGEEIGIEGDVPKGQAHLIEVEPLTADEIEANPNPTPKRGAFSRKR